MDLDSNILLPSSAKVKNGESLPLMCLHGAVPKLRDNFSFITSQCNSVLGNVREHHTEFIWFSCTSN